MRPDRAVRGASLSGERAAWETAFADALRRGDPLAASTILRDTGRKGWVKRAELVRARGVVDDEIHPAPLVRRDWATRLLAHPRRVDKELAAQLLLALTRTHQRDVERAALRLARDDEREVRETAAALLGAALDDAFDAYLPTVRDWVATGDSRARRAAVVAAKLAVRPRHPERLVSVRELVEAARGDADEYVARAVRSATRKIEGRGPRLSAA